ncbi:MAG: DUF4426 domain-containing protein [Gammaproteobacteria bacterium]|jgi:hypothetical protein
MRLITAILLTLACSLASAENSTTEDGYTIHHNAITTDMLSPEIAREYGLIRSRNRAMLNVSVIQMMKDSLGKPVEAEVRASTTNIIGQQRRLNMREIREGDAIYYIADFLVRNEEKLNFHIDVKPEGNATWIPATFSQQFYTN